MESTKATSLLNEILQKLSLLTKEDELAQGIEEIEVKEEVVELEEQAQPAEEIEETQEELSEEVSKEEVTEELEEETNLAEGYVKQEEFDSKMASMEAKLEAMAKMIDEEMGSYKREKEMMSKQIEELSAEPAAEAIKHDPEAETQTSKSYVYGTRRPQNTLDRVFNRLNNK